MTAQEIFDRVWRHFVTEGNPRSMDADECLYRGPNGARCAVGLFIPDDEYLPSMEGRAMGECLGPTVRSLIEQKHYGLLDALQEAHDSHGNEDGSLADALRHIASLRGLTVPS